jgi:hypothetical protein
MWRIYDDAKELGYAASYFARMLDERGALATAQKLINEPQISDGFTKLWELRRLDLTVEAVALRREFQSLFTRAELDCCRARLREFGYSPP